MHIYQLPISLYSFKLRLALKLKGLDIELRDPPGGSYRSPDNLAINPAGTIPALID
ncbi:MAG: glutathione S-transferase N-terminal domain-containing protein, partial [Rhodobacter sp.]|nr:glutathione S-transferase N-terminal domain-containing protein [Rhodobacter sp.]